MTHKQRKGQFINAVVFDLPSGMTQVSLEEQEGVGGRKLAPQPNGRRRNVARALGLMSVAGLFVSVVMFAGSPAAGTSPADAAGPAAGNSDQILVKFKANASSQAIDALNLSEATHRV